MADTKIHPCECGRPLRPSGKPGSLCDACRQGETEVTTREEWMITGQPRAYFGVTFPPYVFVFGSPSRRAHGFDEDPEAAAREFLAGLVDSAWDDGPHLHRRTVTETPWEKVTDRG